MLKTFSTVAACLVLPLAAGCASDGQEGSAGGSTTASTGGASTGSGGSGTSGGATASGGGSGRLSIPSLVNVNLENVLNDLSVRLKLDRANIPVNAQIPINVAANVCGVSINILSVSTGGQAQCTAKTGTNELAQAVQQQISAGGNVGGGDQSQTPTKPGA
jgi:hypothetical protein